MKKDTVKEELISAAYELLLNAAQPEKITSRQIAEKAGVNLALVNYYFESKDQLLRLAAGKIIEDSADSLRPETNSTIPPRQRLEEMLFQLCEAVVRFEHFTKVYIPYLLLQDEILTPYYLVPILKECFGTAKTETECKIIAYQITVFFQLAFLRGDAFYKYTGLNLHDVKVRKQLIQMQLNLFLGGND